MLMMGVSTFMVALLPTYGAIGVLAPILLVVLRLVQGFAVGGEISGASTMVMEHSPFGRRGFFTSFTLQGVQGGQLLAAAVFLPLAAILPEDDFRSWGWRIPLMLSAVVIVVGLIVRREVEETPAFQAAEASDEPRKAPIVQVVQQNGADMLRVVCMALMNVVPLTATVFGATYATSEAYGIGFSTATYLWISVVGNIVAMVLIPFIGSLSDRIGRRPCIIVGALGSTAMAYAYLWAISTDSVVLAFAFALVMWGSVYQGYNAVFPSFYQELFPTRTRVTGFAVSQNIGTMITAFLPSLFAAIAPPGTDVPLIVGSIVFGIGVVVAVAAFSSRETHRVALADLGEPDAVPLEKAEYDRLRAGGQERVAVTR
ncbi:MAG: major facilitator superfamily 1 [Klenkia sp.]|nr:major facilitator superfamily 1 [Klenkia sp.]